MDASVVPFHYRLVWFALIGSCACNRGDLRYRLGFDTENVINSRGIDLSSMRERLKLVDGQQSIESRQQIGTTIHARVPLHPNMKPEVA